MYQKYSDRDLVDAYKNMMDYSGKISPDLAVEIDNRGGLEKFIRAIENQSALDKELHRIRYEVFSLTTPETNLAFVRKLIASDVLSPGELDGIVETYYTEKSARDADRQITTKSIVGTLIGIMIGTMVGAALVYCTLIAAPQFVYWFLVPVYVANYFIINLITKQSRNNPVVFIGAVLATAGSLAVGCYFFASGL
ncbi:MAG: hypothetical protein JWQ27_56 [Ferruginibacter sp.]|nr:hypothetical protein [Ferruginibacter sp.]